MNNNKMNPNARLSFLERFAYGIGDYAGKQDTVSLYVPDI